MKLEMLPSITTTIIIHSMDMELPIGDTVILITAMDTDTDLMVLVMVIHIMAMVMAVMVMEATVTVVTVTRIMGALADTMAPVLA